MSDDWTSHVLKDLTFSKEGKQKPAGKKLTDTQFRVLREVENGFELPFISNPLIYSRRIRAMRAPERKALIALFKAGYLRIERVYGPPSNEQNLSDARFSEAHFVLKGTTP